jgi:hypothetical protein
MTTPPLAPCQCATRPCQFCLPCVFPADAEDLLCTTCRTGACGIPFGHGKTPEEALCPHCLRWLRPRAESE